MSRGGGRGRAPLIPADRLQPPQLEWAQELDRRRQQAAEGEHAATVPRPPASADTALDPGGLSGLPTTDSSVALELRARPQSPTGLSPYGPPGSARGPDSDVDLESPATTQADTPSPSGQEMDARTESLVDHEGDAEPPAPSRPRPE